MNTNLAELYKNYRDRDYLRDGLTAAEGQLLARRLLESDLEPLGLVVSPGLEEEFTALAAGRCPLEVLSQDQMDSLAGFAFHRGVIALARRPRLQELEGFLQTPENRRRLVAVPRLTDPENLGSVVRSASALGWAGLLVGPQSCDPFSRRCAKVSMGTVYRQKPVLLPPPNQAKTLLERYGWTSAACVLEAGAQPLDGYGPPEQLVLWLGNEFDGLDPDWRSVCTQALVLPMAPGVDSLNVAVAAGIFLYTLK